MNLLFAIILALGLLPDESQTTNLHPLTKGGNPSLLRNGFCAAGALEASMKSIRFSEQPETIPFERCGFFLSAINITDCKNNRLTAIGVSKSHLKIGRRPIRWVFRCDCNRFIITTMSHFKNGHTKSCGCLQIETLSKMNLTHGYSRKHIISREFSCWNGIKQRCYNEKATGYKMYGGRGITVSKRWLGPNGFVNFLSDMGPKPTPHHTIDRIDSNGNYEPSNCRWATAREQCNNTSRNIRIKFKGKTRTLAQWAREININASSLYARIVRAGWNTERALKTKVGSAVRTDARIVRFRGESKTLADWARQLGFRYSVLTKRIYVFKWPIERAMTTPLLHQKKTT